MPRIHDSQVAVRIVCLLISGASLGWLVGLSASPVLHVLVTGILAAMLAVVGALAGVRPTEASEDPHETQDVRSSGGSEQSHIPKLKSGKTHVSLIPITFVLVGIVLGSFGGVYARTHDWLAGDPQSIVHRWSITKLKDEEIARRLFDQLYPPVAQSKGGEREPGENEGGETPKNPSANLHAGALLSGVSVKDCQKFKQATTEEDLRRFMKASDVKVQNFEKRCHDEICLRAAVEELVCGGTGQ